MTPRAQLKSSNGRGHAGVGLLTACVRALGAPRCRESQRPTTIPLQTPVCERERERESVCVCVCGCVWVGACVCRVCTCVCIRKHAHRSFECAQHKTLNTQTHRHTDTQTHRHTDTQTHRHTDTQTHRHTGARHRAGRRQRPTNPLVPAPPTPPPSPALRCLGVHAVRENGGNGSRKNARRAVELAVKAPPGVTVRRADTRTRSPPTTRSDLGGAAPLHIRVLAALVVSVAIPPPPRRVAAAHLYTHACAAIYL